MSAARSVVKELDVEYARRIYAASNDIMEFVRGGTCAGYINSKGKMNESVSNATLRYEILSFLRIRFPTQTDSSETGVIDGWEGNLVEWAEQDELEN